MIEQLQLKINQYKAKVKDWFHKQRLLLQENGLPLPIYSSFDIRDSGYKAAIVDSNLFPAGFNNLDEKAWDKAVISFKDYISKIFDGSSILIIPEAHTRNQYYLSNLCALKRILTDSGYHVVIGSLRDDITGDAIEVEDSNGHLLTLEKMRRYGNKIQTMSFKDGLVLLNNDFSVKKPELLDNLNQKIIPPFFLGWYHRRKSTHFRYLDCLIDEFADMLDIDPWFLKTQYTVINDVNFNNQENLESISEKVNELLISIQEKYDQYSIDSKPYVFIKDNSGTYGMGIINASSGSEILSLNRKKRNKMLFGKQRTRITSLMIQEGIQTIHQVDSNPAEPVLYSVGGEVLGGFMRIHAEKNSKSSLNSPGMKFDILLEDNITKPIINSITSDDDLSLYGILADISNIAIGYEHRQQDEQS
ncbi:MAG: glutamate--cysteine ligase [Spirochaetota bacterium]|nr:glutamate--cysteine ligase [Spirochaetota bacterium]